MARRARFRTNLLLLLFLFLVALASVPPTAAARAWHHDDDAAAPSVQMLALPSEASESVLVRPSIDPLPAGVVATTAMAACLRGHAIAPAALHAPAPGHGVRDRLPRRALSPDDSDPH